MLNTIKGVYEQGKIILTEEPPLKTKAEVFVTFLYAEETSTTKRKLGGLEGKVNLPADFNEPF